MEEPLIISHEPSNHLAALAVLMNSNKEEHIKSIHFYSCDGGAVFSIQQEFLLTPGNYTLLSDPSSSAAFCDTSFDTTGLTGLPLRQFMASLKKLQEIDGWKCVVEFNSDCPHETTMVELLTPSRNADLKSLPSLAHDLALAEAALIQSSGMNFQGTADDQSFNGGGVACIDISEQGGLDPISKLGTWIVANPFPAASLTSISTDPQPFVDIPGLETPDRTPIISSDINNQGLQCSLWQTWGTDLELASPRLCKSTSDLNSWRTSCDFSDCVASQGIMNVPSSPKTEDISLWSPSLLDLSLNLPDITLDQQSEALLQLQGPPDDDAQLNIDVDAATFSLPDSTLTGLDEGPHVDASEIDCFSLECFGLDSSTCCSFYPEYTALESQEQVLSSGSLCINADDANAQMNVGINRQAFHGFSPLDTFLGHADNTMASALSSDSNYSNGLPGMPSFSSSSLVDNATYSSTTTTGGTGATTSSDMYWDGRGGMQSVREGRMTRRSAHAQGTSATSSSTMTTQRHNMQRGSSERVTEITIQELSQYFNMPITQASKELKVGLTVLKKKCREFGIPRWPHRKMKSLDSLINNIQDLASEHGGKGSTRVLNAVKELEEQKRLMEEMPGIELAERTKRLRQACFKASYKKRRLLSSTSQPHH